MTKLLYITNGITGSGGLERVLSIKASMLAEKDAYQVHILVLNEENPKPFYDFSDKITFHSITVLGKPLRYFLSYKKGIKNVIDAFKPDIISVCDDGLKGLLFPLVFGKEIPLVYERHASFDIIKTKNNSFWTGLKHKTIKWVMTYGASRFNKFIVLTKGNLSEWQLQNMQVIPNPLPFYSKEKALLVNKTVIVVGSHSYTKGFDQLVTIWELIHKKFPTWQLEFYGKSNSNFDLEKQIELLGLQHTIKLFEPVQDIQEKYANASVNALASRSEGFGMVLIEAMACGLPCVAFDCPSGPADIIKNNEDGFLVPNGAIAAFANKLETLIQNQELRLAMGAKAHQNVLRYQPKTIVKQWDELFQKLVNK